MTKNKWLAAMLNLIPGVGYLYVGTRVAFGVLLLAIWPVAIIGGIVDPVWAESGADAPMMLWDWVVMAMTILPFVVDGYLDAERVNKAAKKSA